ncbi:GNAT family N-acetyltransferase [Bacillus sp. UMB0899]|uniref:GNAT family N-acetyltransferase n=1 Tax=Metabacillus schmidteae TaxID=2730405 RepID=UPI000C7FEE3B|nr:GNAT family N-acetyltransferase [Metabacillus schmidteae]PMC33874.1 GNAT family N-acetyltransferase [Bacillus sp. UMB0899]
MTVKLNELNISDDKSLLDIDTIFDFMQRSYWANRRPKDKIKKSIENSLCYGVYYGGKQVGFARVVTDWATMYYLCDVFIDEEYRGQGIGKKLIEEIISSENLKNLFGYLGTKDAHTLYEQYDFIREQEKVMTRIPDFLRNK